MDEDALGYFAAVGIKREDICCSSRIKRENICCSSRIERNRILLHTMNNKIPIKVFGVLLESKTDIRLKCSAFYSKASATDSS